MENILRQPGQEPEVPDMKPEKPGKEAEKVQEATSTGNRWRNDINTLTAAINNAVEDVFAAREDGTLIFANRRFRMHHNISSREDITTMKIYDIFSHVRDAEHWKQIVEAVKSGKRAENFVISHPLPLHPEVLKMEGNAFWITNDQGEESLWAFGRDITKRVKAEREAKRFNQILNKVIDNLPASIVVKDIENGFKYIYRNRESYNRELNQLDPIGRSDFDFHPREVAEAKRKQDFLVAATGKEMHWVEEDHDQTGNLIYIDKRKLRIESDDFPPILLNIDWDITEMERMRRELIRAKEKAETSDRLKSAFLANMSHEIRTPLNAIVGFSRIIAESPDPEERKSYYDIIESNNERLLQLINEILDLSKIEAGMTEFHIAPVRLHPLCQEIHSAHRLHCPEGVRLIFEPSDEELVVKGDKNRIFQVVSNLIGNALKFTTSGHISYGYRRDGEMALFHVSDTGAGISPEKMEKVFDRFVKANDFAQGTGLGLSISKTIIEQLGGHIRVESEPGRGTTFFFTLPLEEDDNPGSAYGTDTAGNKSDGTAQQPDSHTLHTVAKKKILIAEDTESNFSLLQAFLERDYHLERARDGMEAVSLFEDMKPDLILMDMKMPNLSGIDATKIIRELSPDVPIFAITAYAFEQDRKLAMEIGCNEFFTKPYLPEQLKEMVERYLGEMKNEE